MLALQFIVGLGIALLFPLLVYSAVGMMVRRPKRTDFFDGAPAGRSEAERQAYHTQLRRNTEAWQQASARYAKILFSVLTPAGVAAILGGYLIGINAIGIGLLAGGILCTVYGYAGHWNALQPWMQFVSVLAGFLMLLLIGIRYFV